MQVTSRETNYQNSGMYKCSYIKLSFTYIRLYTLIYAFLIRGFFKKFVVWCLHEKATALILSFCFLVPMLPNILGIPRMLYHINTYVNSFIYVNVNV